MTIKELSSLYWLNREIASDQRKLDELAEEIRTAQERLLNLETASMSPSGAGMTGEPSSPSYSGSKVERYVTDIIDLQRLLETKRATLSEYAMAVHARQMLAVHERNKLERYIRDIDDAYVRDICYHRFIDGKSWDETADEFDDATAESVKKRFYRYARKIGLR